MLIFIIINAFIIYFIVIQFTPLPYNDDTLLSISSRLKEKCHDPFFKDKIMPISINNKDDYIKAWHYVIDMVYAYDQNRNVLAVNMWNLYVVAYYTEYVIKYGSRRDKKVLCNFVKLIERNGFLNE